MLKRTTPRMMVAPGRTVLVIDVPRSPEDPIM
jgi:hypothetical protein